LAAIDDHRRSVTNAASITNAIGWANLFNSFGGGSKTPPGSLLPFKEEEFKTNELSDQTRRILRKLSMRGVIPPRVWGAIAHLHREIEG